jgi:hypothetical protein
LIDALENGATSQAALEKVYAKPLATIEKDLQVYIASGHISATSIPVKSSMLQQPEPAPSFELNLVLAAIYNRPGQDKEAQDRLESFSRANDARPEPWAGLGYVALRRGQLDLAAQNFERALALGARNPELMWDHARLDWRDSTADTEEALNRVLQKEPNRVDARVKLAAIYLDRRKPRPAYDLLQVVKEMPAGDTPRFLAELAYAEVELGERTQAQVTLARLEKSPESPRDTAELNRLKGYLTGERMTVATVTPEKTPEKAPEKTPEKAPEKPPVVARVTLGSSAGSGERQKAAEAFEKAAAAAREKASAEAQALEAAESLERQAAAAREKVAALARERAAADAQEKAAAKAREKADADANAKDAAEAREKAAAEAREKVAAEAREKAAAKAREKAEAEAEALAKAKAAAEAKEKALAEVHEKAVAEARAKAEAEAEAQAQAQARAKAAADAREKALAEARAKAAPTLVASNIVPPSVAAKIAPADDISTGSLPPAPVVPKADDSSIAAGTFVEMVCLDTQIKIVLQTPEGKKNYLIADPTNVVVSGREGGRVELDCGPQKPVNIRVLYGGPAVAPFDGLVKGLYFD